MKKLSRLVLQTLTILFITLLLIELIYRYSVIDFYKPEFDALNPPAPSNNVDYLFFGDSFSATQNSYINVLRTSNNQSYINVGVSGIGIKQVNTFANRRLKEFNPEYVVYQVYVGNDLIDVDHLTNYSELSLIRNLYWDLSDILLSISYLNYRLGGMSTKKLQANTEMLDMPFSSKMYSPRSKMNFKSDKQYLYHTVLIKGDFENRYLKWIAGVRKFIKKNPKETPIYIIFIPHCAQVNSFYRDNMKQIGAFFPKESEFSALNYPFFKKASLDLENYKNVTLLNPLKYLREKDSVNRRLYYLNDPHLNNTGQELLGQYLKEQFISNK